jgi:mannitol/fructose-specific phosphotransferase system IIA component (Ntr-type)
VSDLLALLVPPKGTVSHLELLASFVQMFADHAFRAALGRCSDAHSVWRLFDERLRE